MEDKNKIPFKKARFHLSESCCTSSAKIKDIDENDEVYMNSLDELIEEEKNNKDDNEEK